MRLSLALVIIIFIMPVGFASITLPLLTPTLRSDQAASWSAALDDQGNQVLGSTQGGLARVSKYDPQGHLLWQRSFGKDYAWVTVDATNNVIAGSNTDAWLSKWSPDGSLQWQMRLPHWRLSGVTTDGANIYAATEDITVPTGVAKVSPAGALVWDRIVSTRDLDFPWAIAASPDGRTTIVSHLDTHGLDAAGNIAWTSNLAAYGVAMDPQGNAYVGAITGYTLLGPVGFLAKLSPSGSVLWSHPDAAAWLGFSGNNLVVASVFTLGIGLGPVPQLKGFVVDGYNPDGVWQWGFHHLTGTWVNPFLAAGGNVAMRNGALTFTALDLDAPVYSSWLASACDSNPLMNPPATARACVFTPL